MKRVKTVVAALCTLALTACGGMDTATRLGASNSDTFAVQGMAAPSVKIVSYDVKVPSTLKISEANSYYPAGDIVWREDPYGDRAAQISAIFNDSLGRVASTTNGVLPAKVEIELVRFHALTEKTRLSIGGVHNMRFFMTVRDQNTGAVLIPRHFVEANLKAYGGDRAFEAVRKGLTQKVRITQHLANVIATELSAPGSTDKRLVDLVAGLESSSKLCTGARL